MSGGPRGGVDRRAFVAALSSLVGAAAALLRAEGAAGPLPVEMRWLEQAHSTLEATDSYTVVLHRRERVDGILLPEEVILLKFKQPFAVYMRWVGDRFNGRELLYVEGENDGRLKVREGGLLGVATFNLRPTSALAMKGNRHPVTEVGLGTLVRKLRSNLVSAYRAGCLKWTPHPPEAVYGRTTQVVEWFTTDNGYYCPRAVTFVDNQLSIPIKTLIFDVHNRLVEEYSFEALTLDAGLGDADFDPANPAYRFSK